MRILTKLGATYSSRLWMITASRRIAFEQQTRVAFSQVLGERNGSLDQQDGSC